MYGETYYNMDMDMGVMNIPYGNDAAGKFNNAKWYQAICNAAGLVPTGCARSDPPYSYAKAVYGAGEAYGCNPSSSLMNDCGWQNVITFLAPPKDSSDSTENIDAYGLCGNSCTISSTTGWSPICMEDPAGWFSLLPSSRTSSRHTSRHCHSMSFLAPYPRDGTS